MIRAVVEFSADPNPQDLKNGPPIPHFALWLENGPFWASFCLGPSQLRALRPHSYATGYETQDLW